MAREELGAGGSGFVQKALILSLRIGVSSLEFPLPMADSDALLEISSLFCYLFTFIFKRFIFNFCVCV